MISGASDAEKRVSCKFCTRNFFVTSINKHEIICKRVRERKQNRGKFII